MDGAGCGEVSLGVMRFWDGIALVGDHGVDGQAVVLAQKFRPYPIKSPVGVKFSAKV